MTKHEQNLRGSNIKPIHFVSFLQKVTLNAMLSPFTKYDLEQVPKGDYRNLSGDLRQGSSNNSVTNFVQGFPYVFQREKQPSFEDLLLVVLVILRRRSATRF